MRAISSLSFECGISVRACSARLALRMRVSMSATGSVSIALLSPGALRHAGDHALVRELAQADPAEAELAEHGARPAALVAARVAAHLELLRPRGLDPQRFLGHCCYLPPSAAANGSPSPVRSARACSSSTADVVIVTSRPRIWPMLS